MYCNIVMIESKKIFSLSFVAQGGNTGLMTTWYPHPFKHIAGTVQSPIMFYWQNSCTTKKWDVHVITYVGLQVFIRWLDYTVQVIIHINVFSWGYRFVTITIIYNLEDTAIGHVCNQLGIVQTFWDIIWFMIPLATVTVYGAMGRLDHFLWVWVASW